MYTYITSSLKIDANSIINDPMYLQGLNACYRKKGQMSQALEHGQQQLTIAQTLNLQLGQAHAKNSIALALTELGDMEGCRRNLDEALQHCRVVVPAGREIVQQQLALFLCTTLANLADHSVKVGQFQEAMRWVRDLQNADKCGLSASSIDVWAARALSIRDSIHKNVGADHMRKDDEAACVSESNEALHALAETSRAGGNITRMCWILEDLARRYP